jgi:hypothetical protein
MQALTTRTESASARFRCAPMLRFPFGAASEAVYFPIARQTGVIGSTEGARLRSCAEFRTLGEHAQRIELAGTELNRWVTRGGFVSEEQIRERILTLSACESRRSTVEWLVIPTCSRPERLRRALDSYIANTLRYDREVKIFVADDSARAQDQESNREVIRKSAEGGAIRIYHAGADEKRSYVRRLAAECGVPVEAVGFLLCPNRRELAGIGANRNAALLHTAGSLFLSCDDDTLCVTGQGCCSSPETLRIAREADVVRFWTAVDFASALRMAKWTDRDVIAEHESLLGRACGAALCDSELMPDLDMDEMSSQMFRDLWSGRGVVGITSNGVIGDSGLYSGINLLSRPGLRSADGGSLSAADCDNAVSSRAMVRHAETRTISQLGPFLATCFGLDNRDLLPPFFPVLRNEDGLFADLMRKTREDCYCGNLPWGVVHDPGVERAYEPAPDEKVRFCNILSECIRTWRPVSLGIPPAARLHSLGRHLQEFGSLSDADFEECVRLLLLGRASRLIGTYECALEQTADYPENWKALMRGRIETLRQAVEEPGYYWAVDLARGAPEAEATAATRRLIAKFGNALTWWPRIVESSRAMASDGYRLGICLTS